MLFRPKRFKPYIAKDRRCGDLTFDFWIADEVAKAWYDTSPNQELPEKSWCRDHIKSGDRVIDAGAHHGMMSVLFSKWVGSTGRVTSYEIHPTNHEAITKNLQLNNCHNVELRRFGVGETGGQIMLADDSGNAANRQTEGKRVFEVRSLNEDLATQRVDFLKIDVEGSELAALRGARKIIKGQHPTICLELHCFLYANRSAELRAITAELTPHYNLQVLEHIFGEPRQLRVENVGELALYENPHLLCTAL